jgi:hypothetical protein
MIIIDYNGTGLWTVEKIISRYCIYVKRYRIASPRDIKPVVHVRGEKQWVYPVMDRVIEGIEHGDLACAEIGIEFIEEDASFRFGKTLKSNTARALRRAALTDEQKEQIRIRVVAMLKAGYLPREYVQYAKLARKIGLGNLLHKIKDELPVDNPWVQHYYRYFEEHACH